MDISPALHPSEWFRKIDLAWRLFWEDQDFRFPELRRRLGLELTFRAQALDIDRRSPKVRQFLNPLLEEFDRSDERIPFIEFWLLFEWNERFQQASSLIDLVQLKQTIEDSHDTFRQEVLARLNEIEFLMMSDELERDANWIRLIGFRMRQAALRDEVSYFRSLIL